MGESTTPAHWTEIESCVRDDAAKLPRINRKGLEVPHWDRTIEVACKWIAGLREAVTVQNQRIADLEAELKTKQDALNHWSKEAQEQTYRANQLEAENAKQQRKAEMAYARGARDESAESAKPMAGLADIVAQQKKRIAELEAERDEAISRMQTAREHLEFVLDAPTAAEAHKIAQRGYELTTGPQLPVTEAMVRKAEEEPSDGGAG